jgi:predicted MFS family arabinose efflux permease
VRLSWRGVNLLFLGCIAVQFTGEGHVNAFTPLLLRELGLSEAEVAVWSGLLFAITAAMALPMSPFWGALAERFSGKPVILRSYYLMSASLLVAAWAQDIVGLIVSRMLMGLSLGSIGVTIATQALMTPRPRLGLAIATVQAAIPISASLGPPLGALAIPLIGLRGLFLVDSVAILAAALALTVLLHTPVRGVARGSVLGRTGEALGLVWRLPAVRWNFISTLLMRGATAIVDSYLPVRIAQTAPDPALAIGWILGIYGALTALATWLLGRFVERVDQTRLYWQSMLFATMLAAGLALAPWLWLIGLLAALRSMPVAFSNLLLFTHQARVVPADHQTVIFGLAPVPRNIGGLLFPLLAAPIAGLGVGAALGLGAFVYGLTYLSGLKMAASTPRAPPAGGQRSAVGR